MGKYILEMEGITKTFSGVKALDNVNFQVKPNHIHALVGENGAGKSTLMNILSGVYPHGTYEGNIIFEGDPCVFREIKDSEKKGIAIIHQELALIPGLSVAENVFLGNEQAEKGIINWNKTRNKTMEMLKLVDLDVRTDVLVRDLGLGKQQMIEIVKALAKDVKLLILDEPTASLNDEDSDHLLDLLVELKKKGITSIIISHKLNEITKVAEEITVLRDGKTITTLEKGVDDISEEHLIKLMVGREMTDRYPKRHSTIGEVSFRVKDWNVYDPQDTDRKIISNANIEVRKGEVLGISGLMGAGRTEFALSLFGRAYGSKISGTIEKDGKELKLKNISDAIDSGLAYATEDRKTSGLVLIDNILHNITLAALKNISKNDIIDHNKEIRVAEEFREKLDIKSSSIMQHTGNLSGGNQQKVMFSKWIFADPDVLILDEPTRGVDVGAKYEIHSIINELAEKGKSIIMISSELPELLGMCDRIYVMNRGCIVGEMAAAEASQESIMGCIMQSNNMEVSK